MVEMRIYRGSPGHQYWEVYEVEGGTGVSVVAGLLEIQKNPVTKEGKKVTPVAWEMGCLEEVCGSCSMVINGRPRQACTFLLEELERVTVEPLKKFPLVRDLIVDRSSMFENLKRVHAWVEGEDGDVKVLPKEQEVMYELSTCMTCGCCLEACPQVNARSEFMGAAVVAQAHLFNMHGGKGKKERLDVMMEEAGVTGCGNAQNCVKVCPKNIALTESIAVMFRESGEEGLKRLFGSSGE